MDVAAAAAAEPRSGANLGRREDPLPGPLTVGIRILRRQRAGQAGTAEARLEVGGVQLPYPLQVFDQRVLDRTWQHGDPVLVACALAHQNLVAAGLDVLHPSHRPVSDLGSRPLDDVRAVDTGGQGSEGEAWWCMRSQRIRVQRLGASGAMFREGFLGELTEHVC